MKVTIHVDVEAALVGPSYAFGHRGPGIRVTIGRRTVEVRRRAAVPGVHTRPGRPAWNQTRRGGLFTESALPLPGVTLSYTRRRLSYGEAVASRFTDTAFDWVIDEFDASFNDLAIATLRYHQDWAVTDCDDQHRAAYQDLIDRLGESAPDFTDKEIRVLDAARAERIERLPNGRTRLHPPTAEVAAVYAAHDQRQNEWLSRITRSRHDFVDIVPDLWS